MLPKAEHVELLESFANASNPYPVVLRLLDEGAAVLPAVRLGMGHAHWKVRRGAAAVVDHIYDVDTLHRLVLLTHDPKKKVRRAAVHALGCDRCKGGVNPIDAIPHLTRSAREDKAISVRRLAVLMLAIQAPEKRIARFLRKILATENDAKIQLWARHGLQRNEAG